MPTDQTVVWFCIICTALSQDFEFYTVTLGSKDVTPHFTAYVTPFDNSAQDLAKSQDSSWYSTCQLVSLFS